MSNTDLSAESNKPLIAIGNKTLKSLKVNLKMMP